MSSDTAAGVPDPLTPRAASRRRTGLWSRWTATPRPTPTATPTPRPTPTPEPIPLYPEIVFIGDVDPTTQAKYRAAMEDVVAYYADRYGVETPRFALYVGADVEAVRAVYREVTGHNPATLRPGGGVDRARGTAAIFLLGDFVNSGNANRAVLAHEYLHVLQGDLSNHARKGTPAWLTEGSAVYEAAIYVGDDDSYSRGAIVRGANYHGELRDLARPGGWDGFYGYVLGAIAAEFLAQQAGASSQIDYWRLLNERTTWQSTFASAFGMTVSEFYDAFEEHLARLLADSPASRMAGVVLGPEGEALQGIRLLTIGRDRSQESWFTETRVGGEFDLHVLDGLMALRIDVRQDGAWRHVGWYGEGGLVTDRSRATTIEVDRSDVSGIEIRLPADPEDLAAVEPPRVQGTVLGPDGTPLAGIGVWVWGGPYENSPIQRSAPDGTFDIAHQNGTFVLRIYSWEDGAWRLLGYYGKGGFTPHEAQAAEIEIAGADVAGIEIRLPGRIRGTVLGLDGAPAEGIALWLRDESTDDHKFVGVSSDGTFDVLYGDGTSNLRVSTLRDGLWHYIGWYGGVTGFTPHEAQAASLEVDGADVTGIEIRLPGRIRGTVRTPDGAPAEGIALWLRDESTDDHKFVGVSTDSTFDVLYGDGTFTLRVSTSRDGLWHDIGWYGGETGFTAEEEQATVITVDGADVSGIEIRLPAAPADLQGPRIRGTVLGADGAPLDGFGVWVWGGSQDNSRLGVTSADGTFDVAHQDGTFVLRIYIWEVKAWRLVGWYGAGGFTANEEAATRIELDGADVTGIEMRLPPRVRGIVLDSDGAPVEGVGLWLWGGSTGSTTSRFGGSAADGTFDLFHRDGTFTIRVYARDGEAWRHIGWYEDDGFTTIDYRATRIELDGADVTDIEIRLRLDPADMPTVE